jgi:hypothetical protein
MPPKPRPTPDNFIPILEVIRRNPVPINAYRKHLGAPQRSQCHGLVRKRSLPMSLSRQSWIYPDLYRELLWFGEQFCPIPFTSIQVNYNTVSAPHKDKHNSGATWIVALGNYTGGRLILDPGTEDEVRLNIRHEPFLFHGSTTRHSSEPFEGERISLVYHTQVQDVFPGNHRLQDYRFSETGKIIWLSPEGEVVLDRKRGLPHPLQKRNLTL